jgi:hypothetical protein
MTAQEPPARWGMHRGLALSQPAVYHICVGGCLDDHWAGWFQGMTLTRDDSEDLTLLAGVVADQAALHGILSGIRDLGLPLLSVTRVAGARAADREGS